MSLRALLDGLEIPILQAPMVGASSSSRSKWSYSPCMAAASAGGGPSRKIGGAPVSTVMRHS